MNLELILVIGTLVTGVVWGLYRLRRRGEDEEPWYVEYSRSFFPVLLAVLLLRSFVIEPFRIPSGSMIPTLLVGDFIMVNKSSYGVRLPVVNVKIFDTGLPGRGEVAVFRYPANPREDYIKRVIGLPGDRIAHIDKVIHVNGKPIEREKTGVFTGDGRAYGLEVVEEVLDDRRYLTLVDPSRRGVEGEVVVPAGHYFTMGDNRDHSNDSRFWGFVPEENLVGRAFLIWMSWNAEERRIVFSRIGDRIE